ncbi:histidine kinase dimerization/phosphoacceptor domain -containing protein [Spirosoma sp. KUDC1026]|uniref:tetratricopeptide repeat-containing sensor histidine kinase n=1 Tax=Spirosoma sp. KUDC1026 TaxID=2745947 RepID=UPI00159BBDF5|nr:histidine kinase dimerization/phosphoacceptor domain -containing protein [Spirosoma sp. KUDC1026]QKZ13847.1 tetratricopeptide repeat protein [Spirosoma sp. KUDC1026]
MKRLVALCICWLLTQAIAFGEPLYPMLGRRAVDSLQRALLHRQVDTQRVNILLALSADLITRHEELDEPLGNAYTYSQQADHLSVSLQFTAGQIRSQCALGRLARLAGDRQQAETLLQGVLAYYIRQGNRAQQAVTCYFLGQLYDRTPAGLVKKVMYYERSMELFRQAGQTDKQAYMLKNVADMHAAQGNPARAEQELFAVLRLYRSIGYSQLQYTYDLLSSAYHVQSRYDKALKYELMTVDLAVQQKDSLYLGSFYYNLGILYDELQQWTKAVPCYQKSLLFFSQLKNRSMLQFIAYQLTSSLITHQSPASALRFYQNFLRQYPPASRSERYGACMTLGDCYLALKQYPLAETYYQKMMAAHSGELAPDEPTISGYMKVGTFYSTVKQYDKARRYLNRALGLLKQVGYKRGTASVYLQLFRLDSAQQNYQAAIVHYQTYKALSDSIFNEKKSQQIAQLDAQYQTRQQEQDIALLTRKNQLQQASIQSKDLQRNSIIAGCVLLLLLLSLSYNRYRLKQRTNQLLEAKQLEISQKNQVLEKLLVEKEHLIAEKEWMLKEIHHRVKNNLQIISSMLSAQADYLDDPSALLAIENSRNKIYAIGLIHQKLYQSENRSLVNMTEFIDEIARYLAEALAADSSVSIVTDVTPVGLDVSLAVPLGLIINEAVTNALKYAFPQQRKGQIRLELHVNENQTYQLSVSDDGVGLPTDFDVLNSNTLGLTMIRGLARQLNGRLTIRQDSGTHLQLHFPQRRATSHTLVDESATGSHEAVY